MLVSVNFSRNVLQMARVHWRVPVFLLAPEGTESKNTDGFFFFVVVVVVVVGVELSDWLAPLIITLFARADRTVGR